MNTANRIFSFPLIPYNSSIQSKLIFLSTFHSRAVRQNQFFTFFYQTTPFAFPQKFADKTYEFPVFPQKKKREEMLDCQTNQMEKIKECESVKSSRLFARYTRKLDLVNFTLLHITVSLQANKFQKNYRGIEADLEP